MPHDHLYHILGVMCLAGGIGGLALLVLVVLAFREAASLAGRLDDLAADLRDVQKHADELSAGSYQRNHR